MTPSETLKSEMLEYDLETINRARLPTIEEMVAYWGTPCKDWAPNCSCCVAWTDWRTAVVILERLSECFEQETDEKRNDTQARPRIAQGR